MSGVVRSVLAALVGIVLFLAVVSGVEAIGSWLYPPPAGLDLSKPEELERFVATLPPAALWLVVGAWALATFVGGWTAARVAGRAPLAHAGIVGGVGALGGLVNLLMVPHPAWMWLVGLASFPLGAYLAALAAGRRESAGPA